MLINRRSKQSGLASLELVLAMFVLLVFPISAMNIYGFFKDRYGVVNETRTLAWRRARLSALCLADEYPSISTITPNMVCTRTSLSNRLVQNTGTAEFVRPFLTTSGKIAADNVISTARFNSFLFDSIGKTNFGVSYTHRYSLDARTGWERTDIDDGHNPVLRRRLNSYIFRKVIPK